MIKSILCLFEGSQGELNALNTAFLLGKAYGAEIRVLHVSSDPEISSMVDFGILIADPGIFTSIEKANKGRAEKAKDYVSSFALRHHLVLNALETSTHQAAVRFLHLTGNTDNIISHQGRISDLIIIGRETSPVYDLITPALFTTDRPVLLMPQVTQDNLSDWRAKTVILAWNGSPQSANALHNAMPLLEHTEKLHIIVAHDHEKLAEFEEKEEWLRYIRAHDLDADIISVDCGQYSAGEALLDKARKLKADLLVMGAYGHSMFREVVFGGVTEYMLEKSDIPVLLSH